MNDQIPAAWSSPPGRVRPGATWVVIPAYNEATAIRDVVVGVVEARAIPVVVDDASMDDTAAMAHGAGAVVIRHPINLGQGAALQTGIEFALSQGAEFIVTFDADGQHDAGQVGALVKALRDNHADVALGSRFKGQVVDMPWMRRVLLRAAVVFTRLTTGLKVSDAHNGFRAFTAEAAKKLRIRENRMAHASEILEKVASQNMKYVEVPVVVRYTVYSRSKGQSNIDSFNIMLDLLFSWLRR